MTQFLVMGGYAPWVWSSFGLMVAVLIINTVAANRRYRRAMGRLRRGGAIQ
jgi:heme exporter protein CcmD